MRIVLGEGLVTSEGKKHAHNKKLMSPAFNQSSTQSNEKTADYFIFKWIFFYKRTPILMLFQTANDTKVLVLQRNIFVISNSLRNGTHFQHIHKTADNYVQGKDSEGWRR